jgi:hypothetical protein
MMRLSQEIEQERRRWMAFRQALSEEDQEAFQRMFACVGRSCRERFSLGDREGLKR